MNRRIEVLVYWIQHSNISHRLTMNKLFANILIYSSTHICKTNPIQRITLSRRRNPGAPGNPISTNARPNEFCLLNSVFCFITKLENGVVFYTHLFQKNPKNPKKSKKNAFCKFSPLIHLTQYTTKTYITLYPKLRTTGHERRAKSFTRLRRKICKTNPILSHPLIHSYTHPLIYSFTHSLIYPSTHFMQNEPNSYENNHKSLQYMDLQKYADRAL